MPRSAVWRCVDVRTLSVGHRIRAAMTRCSEAPGSISTIGVVDAAVRGEDVAAARTVRAAGQIGDAAAGLLDDQRARRDVPRVERLLPEAVEPARRDVAEIEGRRAEPPHRARDRQELRRTARRAPPASLLHVVGKPGAEQRIDQRRGRRHAQRRAVEPGAVAALGGEQLAPGRIVDRRRPTGTPSISSASDEQKIGRPCAKLVVPSTGSNTQQYSGIASRSATAENSSPSTT